MSNLLPCVCRDMAVKAGMDIINLSLGGGTSSWQEVILHMNSPETKLYTQRYYYRIHWQLHYRIWQVKIL
jgi:hypothetical protein